MGHQERVSIDTDPLPSEVLAVSENKVQKALMFIAYKIANSSADMTSVDGNEVALLWVEKNAALYRTFVEEHTDQVVDTGDEDALIGLYNDIVASGPGVKTLH